MVMVRKNYNTKTTRVPIKGDPLGNAGIREINTLAVPSKLH